MIKDQSIVKTGRSCLNLVYTDNNSKEGEIQAHLERCNDRFVPSLDSRVDIGAYSRKLFKNSYRIEAWCEDELVGLVAFYLDAPVLGSAFITNVSIDQKVSRKGVASYLMKQCIAFANGKGFRHLHLQVDRRNRLGLDFYQRLGFTCTVDACKDELCVQMILAIQDGKAPVKWL